MIPATLHLSASRQARLFLVALHAAAAVVAIALPLHWCVAVLLGILAHWFGLCRRVQQPAYLQALPDGQVDVTWLDGMHRQMMILPSSVITPWLVVLHLSEESGRVHLILWSDSAERDVLRQWRVWLRWKLPALKRRLAQAENGQD